MEAAFFWVWLKLHMIAHYSVKVLPYSAYILWVFNFVNLAKFIQKKFDTSKLSAQKFFTNWCIPDLPVSVVTTNHCINLDKHCLTSRHLQLVDESAKSARYCHVCARRKLTNSERGILNGAHIREIISTKLQPFIKICAQGLEFGNKWSDSSHLFSGNYLERPTPILKEDILLNAMNGPEGIGEWSYCLMRWVD